MDKDSTVYLHDIQEAIGKIGEYTIHGSFDQFAANGMQHDAVIRQLEIIGEATRRLPESFIQQYPDFPMQEAISMRNFLIHGYDEVDLQTVWKTVQKDLPLLKKQVLDILEK